MSSIHYNAQKAQLARTQWFKNRKDIPIGEESVTRSQKMTRQEEKQEKAMLQLPQVNLDPNYIFGMKPNARMNWIQKCVKLAELQKLSLQGPFYQIVINKSFYHDLPRKQQQNVLFKLLKQVKFFSAKQAQFLSSVHYELYAKFGEAWEVEKRQKQEELSQDEDELSTSSESSAESEGDEEPTGKSSRTSAPVGSRKAVAGDSRRRQRSDEKSAHQNRRREERRGEGPRRDGERPRQKGSRERRSRRRPAATSREDARATSKSRVAEKRDSRSSKKTPAPDKSDEERHSARREKNSREEDRERRRRAFSSSPSRERRRKRRKQSHSSESSS